MPIRDLRIDYDEALPYSVLLRVVAAGRNVILLAVVVWQEAGDPAQTVDRLRSGLVLAPAPPPPRPELAAEDD